MSGQQLVDIVQSVRDFIWGPPLILFIVGTGLYLTFRLRGIQFRSLGAALRLVVTPRDAGCAGDISHFQALMTALAATIGIGNIAGVATALAIGGLGSLFWMVIASLVGMATTYSEAYLSVHYRERDQLGQMSGGPMYTLERGLRWRWLAILFAIGGAIAALATGNMVQVNSITDVLVLMTPLSRWGAALIILVVVIGVLVGGIRSIGRVAGVLVPVMAAFYLLGGVTILIIHWEALPAAMAHVIESAFTGQAAVGGFAGSTFLMALRMGVSRGLFASEAGLGSSSIAAAAARTDCPGRQALISMTGAFISVCVVCTVTGLVIAVTQVLGGQDSSGELLNGVPLTTAAFDSTLPYGRYIIFIGAILFGYSTILGWAYYGEKCVEYLFHERAIWYYRLLFAAVIIPGALLDLRVVWNLADLANALMAIPNLLSLIALSGFLAKETHTFLATFAMEKRLERFQSAEDRS